MIDGNDKTNAETPTIVIKGREDKEKLCRIIKENTDKGPIRVTFG